MNQLGQASNTPFLIISVNDGGNSIMIYIVKIKLDFAGKNYKIDGVRFTNVIDTLC